LKVKQYQQRTLDGLRLGGNRQMSSLGLESVLIGDVGDFVGDTIITNEAVGSLDGDGLVLGSNVLQLTSSISGLAIASLPAMKKVSIS